MKAYLFVMFEFAMIGWMVGLGAMRFVHDVQWVGWLAGILCYLGLFGVLRHSLAGSVLMFLLSGFWSLLALFFPLD